MRSVKRGPRVLACTLTLSTLLGAQVLAQSERVPGYAMIAFTPEGGDQVMTTGYADIANAVPIDEHTVFCTGSVSKSFTAFAALQMVVDGLIGLDEDVRPDLDMIRQIEQPITLRQLIHHTSGLKDAWMVTDLRGIWMEMQGFEQKDLYDVTRRTGSVNFVPGSNAEYSNTGYTVLAALVENRTGVSIQDYMREKVFRHLNMTRTQYKREVGQIIPGAATPYQRGNDGIWTRQTDDGALREVPLVYASYGTTNVWTSAADLAQWAKMLARPGARFRDTVALMKETGSLNDGTELSYGGGIWIEMIDGHPYYRHGGHDQEFYATMIFSDDGYGAVAVHNVRPPRGHVEEALTRLRPSAAPRRQTLRKQPPPTGIDLSGTYLSQNDILLEVRAGTDGIVLDYGGDTTPVTFIGHDRMIVGDDPLDWVHRELRADGIVTVRGGTPTLAFSPRYSLGVLSSIPAETYTRIETDDGRACLDRFRKQRTYYNRELDSVLRIQAEDGHLRVTAPYGSSRQAKCITEDLAFDGWSTYRFGSGAADDSVYVSQYGWRRLELKPMTTN